MSWTPWGKIVACSPLGAANAVDGEPRDGAAENDDPTPDDPAALAHRSAYLRFSVEKSEPVVLISPQHSSTHDSLALPAAGGVASPGAAGHGSGGVASPGAAGQGSGNVNDASRDAAQSEEDGNARKRYSLFADNNYRILRTLANLCIPQLLWMHESNVDEGIRAMCLNCLIPFVLTRQRFVPREV